MLEAVWEEVEGSGVARVDLPEHGAVHLPLAGLGGRALAALVDGVVIAVVGLLLALVAELALGGVAGLGLELGGEVIAGPTLAVLALSPFGLPMLFELFMQGQTPGKRLCDLRVVGADGMPATRAQIFLRNALRVVDFLPVAYVLGSAVVFATRSEQRLGDLVAGTLVVREDPRAFEELAPVGAHVRRSPDLHGLPAPLLQAAALLAAPGRPFEPDVFTARQGEVLSAVRAHRPDLAQEDDPVLWERIVAGLGQGPG